MPDFYVFERNLRKALLDASNRTVPVAQAARSLASVPEENRPRLFKERTAADLSGFVERAIAELRSRFAGKTRFSTSDDNREGKDLLEEATGTRIEIKSGVAKTDANIGYKTVAWAMSCDATEQDALHRVMIGSMNDRRSLFSRGVIDEVIESRRKTASHLGQWLRQNAQRIKDSATARRRFSDFCWSISQGRTTLTEMRALRPAANASKILMLECDWNAGFVDYGYRMEEGEALEIKIEGPTAKDRVTLSATSLHSGFRAILYPHYKNSFKDRSTKVRIPCEHWVRTPCFHVWLGSS